MKRFWNKYTRAGLIALLGVLLASVAFVINNNIISSQVQTQKVIVTKEDIPPYMEITKETLEYKEIVIGEVPTDAISDSKDIEFGNAFAGKYGFQAGAALRKGYITTAEESDLGSAIGLKDGMRLIGVRTDLAMTAGDEVKPGVLVDAYAYFSSGSDAREGQSGRIINPGLTNLKVVKRLNSEGTVPDREAGNSLIPAVVVLEVTPEQAADLMEYQEIGKVYLLPSGSETLVE